MRNLLITTLCLVFVFSFNACERESLNVNDNVISTLSLPNDAPEFVRELADHLAANAGEVESRSTELSLYKFIGFKPELSILKAVIDRVPGLRLILDNQLLGITLFAPTNDAFVRFLADNGFASLDDVPTALLNQVLANHILFARKDVEWLAGYMKTLAYADCDVRGRLTIFTTVLSPNNAIINGDINITFGNGFVGRSFIHYVDKVIAPSTVQTLITSNPEFSTLVQAVNCAGLDLNAIAALAGNGAFTVFAPTNAAFNKLTAALGVASVCDIPVATLQTVLAYHVKVGASLSAVQLVRGATIPTLAGFNLKTVKEGTGVKIIANSSEALVVIPEIQANNGLVHGIDTVLLP